MKKLTIHEIEQALINHGIKNTISLTEEAMYRLYKAMVVNNEITGSERIRFIEYEKDRLIKKFENNLSCVDTHIQEMLDITSSEHKDFYENLLMKIRNEK